MVTDRREERLGHFAFLQGIHHLLKLRHQLAGAEPGEVTAALGRPGVFRVLASQFGKVAAGAQCLVEAVDALLLLSLLFGRALLGNAQEDVSGQTQVMAVQLLQHTVVVGAHFPLLCAGGHEQGAYLLVAIGVELVAEGLGGVQPGIDGGTNLQFVVDEEVHVLLQVLAVDDVLRVVLVVVVLKFRASDRLSGDGHHHGVAGLRKGRNAACQMQKKPCNAFHVSISYLFNYYYH